MRKLFGIRSCKETLNGRRPRPCLQHQIGRCLAPCVETICALDRYRRSCEDARLFLEGRTDEVVRRLQAEMERAAAGERYEEAASLRDQVQALVRMEAPQKITTTELEERDLLGRARRGRARGGPGVERARREGGGARGLPARSADRARAGAGHDRAAVLRLGPLRPARGAGAGGDPGRASCSRPGSRRGAGTAVAIRVPQRGEKLRLLELVARNARLAFELEWKHPRRQSQEILRSLRDLLDLEVEPQRIECFDISNIQGSDVVASMVVFEGGAAQEGGLPQVPDPQRVGGARTTSRRCARS